jgi:alkaline phosphatase D
MAARVDRREFIGGAATVAAVGALGGVGTAARAMRNGHAGRRPRLARKARFRQGVASGEPRPRAITLWTKLDEIERNGTVELEVARDPGFDRVVHRRRVLARRSNGFTVHARVRDLKPHKQYWYRFDTGERSSPVGRFRTFPPPDSRQPARIGVFSCQDFVPGYYTAHAGLASEPDLDLIVCLGDYIYERRYYDPAVRQDALGANGDGEVQTLAEYRDKYALYHSDPNLAAVRQAFPLMGIWDDHEVEDNYAGDLPGDATRDPRVGFDTRRASAYRAFFEHMPFRPAGRRRRRKKRRRRRGSRNYRSLRIGRSAELILLDERQYRDDQPCGDAVPPLPPCPPGVLNDPSRTMLGADQKAWLKGRLQASDADWKLIGNQVMAMALDVPLGNPLVMDQWDGYAAERREVLQHIAARGIRDVSFLTGDIHTFFAGQVTPSGRQLLGSPPAVATEFVAGSMTSLGVPETINSITGVPLPPDLLAIVADAAALKLNNPHMAYSNVSRRGYGVVEADRDGLEVTFRSPQTTQQPQSSVSTLKRFRVERGTPTVHVL